MNPLQYIWFGRLIQHNLRLHSKKGTLSVFINTFCNKDYLKSPVNGECSMKKIQDIKQAMSNLPDKKRYAELLTAVLSIPVLITVLLLNINNLRPKTQEPSTIATQSGMSTTSYQLPTQQNLSPSQQQTPTISPPQACIKEVGPIDITSPEEGEVITQNPVCIDIQRNNQNYCEVAWSYRINNDPWSEYIDKAICLYNMTPGEKTIEVRVKSIASSDQTILKRTFTIPALPTPTQIATSSSSIQ